MAVRDEDVANLPLCDIVLSESTFWRAELNNFKSPSGTELVIPTLDEMCHWRRWEKAAEEAYVSSMSLVASFLMWTRIQASLLAPHVRFERPTFESDYYVPLSKISASSSQRGWLLGDGEGAARAQVGALAQLALDRLNFAEEVSKKRREAFNKLLVNKFIGRDEFLIPHLRAAIEKFSANPHTPAENKADESVYKNATRMANFMMKRWGDALDFLEWECRRTTRRVYGLLYDGTYRHSDGALKIIREATEENKQVHIRNVAIRLIHVMTEMRTDPAYYARRSELIKLAYDKVYLPHLRKTRERYVPLYTDAELRAVEEEEEKDIEEYHEWQSIPPTPYSDDDGGDAEPSLLGSPKDYFSSDEEAEDDGAASSSTAATRKRPRLRRMDAQIVPEGGTFADVVDLTGDDSQEEKKQRLQALIRQLLNS